MKVICMDDYTVFLQHQKLQWEKKNIMLKDFSAPN